MSSMNVSMTPALTKIVQDKVASGLYNNASEVIREAIRQLDTNTQLLHELKLLHLKKTLEPGLLQAQSGQYADYTYDKLLNQLNNKSID